MQAKIKTQQKHLKFHFQSDTRLEDSLNNDFFLTHRDLGHIAGGMSCDFLKLWTNDTDFVELLQFVSELPGGIRPALVRNVSHKNLCFHENAFFPVLTSSDVPPAKMYHRGTEKTT